MYPDINNNRDGARIMIRKVGLTLMLVPGIYYFCYWTAVTIAGGVEQPFGGLLMGAIYGLPIVILALTSSRWPIIGGVAIILAITFLTFITLSLLRSREDQVFISLWHYYLPMSLLIIGGSLLFFEKIKSKVR